MKILLLIFIILQLVSCGELTGDKTGANDFLISELIGGQAFIELSNGKNLLSGTMKKGEAHSFRINFQLPENESASFFFYANQQLENGLSISFTRSGDEIITIITLNGITDRRSLGKRPNNIDLILDVHNDHEDAHILLWNYKGPYGDTEECVEDKSCLYNSEFYTFPNDGPWGGQGKASGTFWGVQGPRSFFIKLEGPSGAISDA